MCLPVKWCHWLELGLQWFSNFYKWTRQRCEIDRCGSGWFAACYCEIIVGHVNAQPSSLTNQSHEVFWSIWSRHVSHMRCTLTHFASFIAKSHSCFGSSVKSHFLSRRLSFLSAILSLLSCATFTTVIFLSHLRRRRKDGFPNRYLLQEIPKDSWMEMRFSIAEY